MRSVRLLVVCAAVCALSSAGLAAPTLAAEPGIEVYLSVAPDSSTVGSQVSAKALVTFGGIPVSEGTVSFDVAAVDSPDYGPTSGTGTVVDGVASVAFSGGLVAGTRTMTALFARPQPSGTTTSSPVAFTVSRSATTTTVSVAPHPTVSGVWTAVPTISHAGGVINKGECSTYLDGTLVDVSLNCLGATLKSPVPGVHTVRVDYVGDPFGIPSDRQLYEPSSGTTTFTVQPPAPVIVPAPVPPVAITTTAKVSVAKVVKLPKAAVIKVAVAASDGSLTTGPVTLKITGAKTVTKKVGLKSGKATIRIKLKPGRYKVTAIYGGYPGAKSSTVSFKVK